jgi:hypothetical protein
MDRIYFFKRWKIIYLLPVGGEAEKADVKSGWVIGATMETIAFVMTDFADKEEENKNQEWLVFYG